jgi:hypothetical protein
MRKNTRKFIEEIRKNPERNRFVILIVTGLIFTVASWFYFPPDFPKIAIIAIIWVSISMGLFWVVDRILHAVADAAGETERDGVIWLVPIALGWIPICLGWIFSFKYLFLSIIVYCIASYVLVTIYRPEIHPDRLNEIEIGENGLKSWKNLFHLFRYKMDVVTKTSKNQATTQPGKFRFFSISYLFYTACFGGLALITSTKEGSNIKYMGEAITVIVGGTGVLIPIIFATAFASKASKKAEIPWPIQQRESFILSVLFIITVIYLIAFLYWAKELHIS